MQEHDIEQLRDEHKSATEVTMPTDVKQRIYQIIDDNNTVAVKRKTNRRRTYWASSVATVAAVAIVIGGFAAYSHQGNVAKSSMGSHQKGTPQTVTTAAQQVKYTAAQMKQLQTLGASVGISTVYVLTNYTSPKLLNVDHHGNVLMLNYGNLTIYEGARMSDVENYLKSSSNATLSSGDSVTLSSGIPAQWQVLTSGHTKIGVLAPKVGQTYVAMKPSSASLFSRNELESIAASWTVISTGYTKQPSPYNPPAQDAAYVQIGNLKLGKTFSEVQKLYGLPTTKTTAHGEGGPEWIYNKLGLNLGGDPLWQITVASPFSGALPSGIHIGSSEHEVQKAYPHATVHHLSGETSFTEQSSDKQYNLYISVSNGKVSSITVEASTPSPPVN